nr:tenascin [Aedes albopictus]
MRQKILNLVIFLVLLGAVSASELLDLSCDDDKECETFNSSAVKSTCSNGTCHCELIDGGNQTDCKPVVVKVSNQIGGQCPCHAENSYCNEETKLCICKEGFIPSREGKRCMSKSVELGKTCEIDEQCIINDHFSHCDDAHLNCTCSNHFVIFQKECRSIIASPEDKPCQQDKDCSNHTANSLCHEHQCICQGGFVANAENSTCLPIVHYEQQCSDSNQCIAQLGIGSLCSEGKCVCNEQYYPFPTEAHNSTNPEHKIHVLCKRKVTHGASCNNNKECYQFHRGPHEQTMECFMNECVCTHGFYEKGGICISHSGSSAIHVSSIATAILFVAAVFSKKLLTC